MFPSEPTPDALFSMAALRRAWKQVRRNIGAGEKRGEAVRFEAQAEVELNRLRQHLLQGIYQPQRVRRFYLKKPNGKQRPISLWALPDRVVQRMLHDYLLAVLEPRFLPCSYGFRVARSVDDALQAVVQARENSLRWVLDADIADCFSSIPVEPLMAQVTRVVPSAAAVRLIALWLNTPVYGERDARAGVSQGGVISPLLANLYLHRFDEMVTAALPSSCLIRFADDFLILSHTESEAVWSLEVARRSLENLHLALNMRKTRVLHFDEGFQFLGTIFQGNRHAPATGTASLNVNDMGEGEG